MTSWTSRCASASIRAKSTRRRMCSTHLPAVFVLPNSVCHAIVLYYFPTRHKVTTFPQQKGATSGCPFREVALRPCLIDGLFCVTLPPQAEHDLQRLFGQVLIFCEVDDVLVRRSQLVDDGADGHLFLGSQPRCRRDVACRHSQAHRLLVARRFDSDTLLDDVGEGGIPAFQRADAEQRDAIDQLPGLRGEVERLRRFRRVGSRIELILRSDRSGFKSCAVRGERSPPKSSDVRSSCRKYVSSNGSACHVSAIAPREAVSAATSSLCDWFICVSMSGKYGKSSSSVAVGALRRSGTCISLSTPMSSRSIPGALAWM